MSEEDELVCYQLYENFEEIKVIYIKEIGGFFNSLFYFLQTLENAGHVCFSLFFENNLLVGRAKN
ncbi:MAG: hypothetical protein U5K51_11310 [Flavobacteriaceae bacterium]|nr:hypothetical protein [Flavobacteriaceae bacterium]